MIDNRTDKALLARRGLLEVMRGEDYAASSLLREDSIADIDEILKLRQEVAVLKEKLTQLKAEADIMATWLANAYLGRDRELLPKIGNGMSPPDPSQVREAACKAVENPMTDLTSEAVFPSFTPNYRIACTACGKKPTVDCVNLDGSTSHAELCGVCFFGKDDCADPENW